MIMFFAPRSNDKKHQKDIYFLMCPKLYLGRLIVIIVAKLMEKTFTQVCFELDAVHSSRQARPLHVFTVFPKIDVDDIPYVAHEAGLGAALERAGENLYTFQIVSAHKRRRAYGYLVDFGNFWDILIRTVESPTVAGNAAELWLKRMYPAICRSYMKSEDLLNILDDLAKIEDAKLELRGYVLRAHDSPETMKK